MPLSLKTKTIIVWLCTLPALALALTLVLDKAFPAVKFPLAKTIFTF